VRITYDPEADAAYIHLTSEALAPGRDSIACDPPEGMQAWVVMDWKDGKIAGLEVLGASSLLHADLIAQAEQPGSRQGRPNPTETYGRRRSSEADPSHIK
jgi:uncharacterized protein YuzE